MSKYIRILCVLALAAMTVGPVSAATISSGPRLIAQVQSATVTGKITDSQSGGPVVNATVTLKGPATYTATTDASGSFSISNVTPGVYSVSVTKAGYNPLTQDTFAVLPGGSPNISGSMQSITFTTLRTIASVRSTARGTFNVTPASVNVVTAQTIEEQGQQQVMQVLNQTPGIEASFPSSSSNGAAPGSITFPNIRGGLSFETASLIDGHPVSVGSFGDYVSTFSNAFTLGNIEIVKGPGVESPNVNYAIGGTVNYQTKEPTFSPQGQIWVGFDDRGGSLLHFDFTGTLGGRLGYALVLADDNIGSALNNYQALFSPSGGIVNYNGTTGQAIGSNSTNTQLPGTISTTSTKFNLAACCQPITDLYQNKAYLAKLRYKMSPVTFLTFTYLGAQSYANQNGNTGDISNGTLFGSTSGTYSGSIANNSLQPIVFVHAGTDREIQNEPILMGDLRTSWGNDTFLARYYAAGIHRLLFQGGTAPTIPELMQLTLDGNNTGGTAGAVTYNDATMPVAFFNYFNQTEDDVLKGWSFEWTHPFNSTNSLTLAVDQTNSTTVSYSVSASVSTSAAGCTTGFNIACVSPSFSLTIPAGSSQLFTTGLARLQFALGPKWSVNWANYVNTYKSTYPIASVNGGTGTAACQFNGANCVYGTTTTGHYDSRVAFEFRPNANLAVRMAAGSAIAPPYLQLLSGLTGTIACSNCTTTGVPTQRINAGSLRPETAFGYNLGADYRFRDGSTTLSVDTYLTNLFNHFLTYTFDSGMLCPAIDPVSGAATPTGCTTKELFFTSNRNLANARMEGLEISLRHRPPVGFGFLLQGSTQRGFAYNLPACFYSTTITNGAVDCTKFNTNLAIIPGQNFTGNGLGSFCSAAVCPNFPGSYSCGCNGFSNQAIPYMQGYAELSYRFSNGSLVFLGDQFMGKNNSLADPPFWILNGGATLAMPNGLSFQANAFNITNTFPGIWPNFGGGVPIPIAGLPPGAPANAPLFAATQGQVLGPRRFQFQFIKRFGGGVTP